MNLTIKLGDENYKSYYYNNYSFNYRIHCQYSIKTHKWKFNDSARFFL